MALKRKSLLVLILLPLAWASVHTKLTLQAFAWKPHVLNSSSKFVIENFNKSYCLQIINDKEMSFFVTKNIKSSIPSYNVGYKTTLCANYFITMRDPKIIYDILKNGTLLNEAKYLIITTTSKSIDIIQEIVRSALYLDVKICVANETNITSPLQLGVVTGNKGRVDLQGRHLSVAGFSNPPFTVYENRSRLGVAGVEVRVVRELSNFLNFTWKLREPKDGQLWGQKNSTGHWTGLKGELAYGDTDLGIAMLYLIQKHHSSFQLSSPYTMICLTFLVPAPKSLLGYWDALIRPFKLSTWISFILIAAIHALMLCAISRKSLNHCILETVRSGALISGPQPKGPISQRILFMTWIVGCFFVAGLYGSELSAWIVAKASETPLRTMQDLAQSNTVWGRKDADMVPLFEDSPTPILRKMVHRFTLEASDEAIEKKVLGGGYSIAVHVLSDGYPSGAEFLSDKARRRLITLPDCLVTRYVSLGMRRGLPLLKATGVELRRLQEAGLLQEWQARDVRRYGDRSVYRAQPRGLASANNEEQQLEALTVSNLAGAFAFWVLGHSLASLMFFLEFLSFKWNT